MSDPTIAPGAVAPPPAPEETALAFVNEAGQVVGLENYDPSMFRLPRIILVQTATQQQELSAPIGTFYNTITQEHTKELVCTILAVNPNRWFGPDYDTSKAMKARNEKVTPWCQSSNGKTPDVGAMAALDRQVQHTSCKACPRAKFVKGHDGRNQAPQCTDMRKALISLPDGSLALFVARKEACREFDSFVQPFFAMRKPMFAVKTKMTARSEKNARGELYYVPVPRADHTQANTPAEQRNLYESIATYTQFLAVGLTDDEDEATTVIDVQPETAAEAPAYTPPAATTPPPAAGPPPVVQPTIDVTATTVAPSPGIVAPEPEPVAAVPVPAPVPVTAVPVPAPIPVAAVPVVPAAAPVPVPVAPAPVPVPVAVAPPAAGPPPVLVPGAAPIPVAAVLPSDPVPVNTAPAGAIAGDEEAPF